MKKLNAIIQRQIDEAISQRCFIKASFLDSISHTISVFVAVLIAIYVSKYHPELIPYKIIMIGIAILEWVTTWYFRFVNIRYKENRKNKIRN